MKRLDDTPIDPEIAASLDAIDATLAGDPVDPRYAELAELALLLGSERPRCSERFARELDARVERRFARPAVSGAGGGAPARPRRRRLWTLAPVWGGGAVAAAVAVVIAIVVSSGGSGSSIVNALSGEVGARRHHLDRVHARPARGARRGGVVGGFGLEHPGAAAQQRADS